MDAKHIERNAASRTRIRAVAEHLSDEELARHVDAAWTVGALFAHVAFWDRFVLERWRLARERDTRVPSGLDDTILDLVNDAALQQWVLLPGRESVKECLSASEEVDAFIRSLGEGTLSEVIVAGRVRLVDRSIHRNEHLDVLEAALSGGSS